MALKPELEEVLRATVKDENYRNSLRGALEANPEFAANWLRQADYDRKMNQMKDQQTQFQEKHKKNVEWFDKANAEYKAYLAEKSDIVRTKSELEAKVADLEARVSGGDYTPGQEGAMVQEIAKLKTTIDGLQSNLSAEFINEQKLNDILSEKGQGIVNFMADSTLDTLVILDRYKNDFGKTLSKPEIQELYAFANENRCANLEEAYQKKFSSEIEELKKEQYKKEWERDYITTHNLPNSGGSSPVMGPVQQRLAQKTVDGLPPDAPMDAVAAAAAASLRSEGKV